MEHQAHVPSHSHIRLLQVALFGALISCAGCKNGGVNPVSGFSFRLNVTNTQGVPVAGLRVSLMNDLTTNPFIFRGSGTHLSSVAAVTSISFDAPVAFVGSLTVHDLAGSEVASLLDSSLRPAGRYLVHWSGPDASANGLYRSVLRALDSSGTRLLFSDSILVALQEPDPALSVVGWTDGSGVFETGNTLLFPYLFNLGPITMTDATGPTALGSFRYLNTATVTLTDTATHRSMSTRIGITDGPTTAPVVWNPTGPSVAPARAGAEPEGTGRLFKDSVIVVVPQSWKLYQNYPNPFN